MIKYLLLCAFFLPAISVCAQDNSVTELEIRALEARGTKAILQGDTNTMKELWAPEFMVNNPRNQVSGNRDSVLLLQKAGMIDYQSFERTIERMQFQENLVITMGLETIIPKTDAAGLKAGQVYKRRYSNIWMKKNGKWQQIARHASVICQ